MKFSIFIALRFLFAYRKRNFINFISLLSMVGVCMGTMALVVVLSVFNGLEDLMKSIYKSFDAEYRIVPKDGKFIEENVSEILGILLKNKHLVIYTEVIEDQALVTHKDMQSVVKLKCVSDTYDQLYNINQYVVEGKKKLTENGMHYALLGRGVQYKLGVDLQNSHYKLQFYYPKSLQKTFQLSPEKAFNQMQIAPGGVFTLEQRYDDQYVLAPLNFGKELTDSPNRLSYFELRFYEPADANKKIIESLLPSNVRMQSRDELHAAMLRAVKIEKLFMYITFTIILVISSVNIFFMLTMLAIEKRRDLQMMYAMGANTPQLRQIFINIGILIASLGSVLGLIFGYLLCYFQETYGFVTMGSETSLVNAYPVKIKAIDFLLSGIIVFVVAVVISLQPAFKATKNLSGATKLY